MFDKLTKPKELLKLGVTGLLVLIVYGLLSPMVPAIVGFGFSFAGIAFSLGTVISALAAAFVADLVQDQLDL